MSEASTTLWISALHMTPSHSRLGSPYRSAVHTSLIYKGRKIRLVKVDETDFFTIHCGVLQGDMRFLLHFYMQLLSRLNFAMKIASVN